LNGLKLTELNQETYQMLRLSSWPAVAIHIVTVILILPGALAAQSFWLERSQGKTFFLEIFKLDNSTGVYNGARYPVDYSFESFASFLTLRAQTGSKSFLVVELPFAHAVFDTKIDSDFSYYRNSGSSNMIGSPYIGFEYGSLNSRFFTEIGIRLPLAKTDNNFAAAIGRASNPDREEAFERLAAIKLVLNYRSKRTRGLTFRARGGAVVQRDLDQLSDDYYSFLLSTQIGYGYEPGRFRLAANFVTQIRFSFQMVEDPFGFEATSRSFRAVQMQYFRLTGNVDLGSVRLGMYLRPPILDSEQSFSLNLLQSSFGLDLAIQR
jgi:hypothetical protein